MVKHNGATYTAFILDSSGSMAYAADGKKTVYDSISEAVGKYIDQKIQGKSKCAVINSGRADATVYSGWKGRKEKHELKRVVGMKGMEGTFFAPFVIESMKKEAPGKFNVIMISDYNICNIEGTAKALAEVLKDGNKVKLITTEQDSPEMEFFTEGLKKYGLEDSDIVVLRDVSELSEHL